MTTNFKYKGVDIGTIAGGYNTGLSGYTSSTLSNMNLPATSRTFTTTVQQYPNNVNYTIGGTTDISSYLNATYIDRTATGTYALDSSVISIGVVIVGGGGGGSGGVTTANSVRIDVLNTANGQHDYQFTETLNGSTGNYQTGATTVQNARAGTFSPPSLTLSSIAQTTGTGAMWIGNNVTPGVNGIYQAAMTTFNCLQLQKQGTTVIGGTFAGQNTYNYSGLTGTQGNLAYYKINTFNQRQLQYTIGAGTTGQPNANTTTRTNNVAQTASNSNLLIGTTNYQSLTTTGSTYTNATLNTILNQSGSLNYGSAGAGSPAGTTSATTGQPGYIRIYLFY
jgi:hypothetical protein